MSNKDLELLKFYHEVGVDCTLTEGEEEKKLESKESVQPSVIQTGTKKKDADTRWGDTKDGKDMFPSDWIIEARKLASKCNSVDELRSAVESFEGCEIKKNCN